MSEYRPGYKTAKVVNPLLILLSHALTLQWILNGESVKFLQDSGYIIWNAKKQFAEILNIRTGKNLYTLNLTSDSWWIDLKDNSIISDSAKKFELQEFD